MVIDEIEVFHVAMPLLAPWRTSTGDMPSTHSLLVRMTSEGVTSWAESTPFDEPRYSTEWAGGAFCLLKECFGPLVVGRRIESGPDMQELLSGFKGNPFAKAALDNAWWTLAAKRAGRPLHEVLGGKRQSAEVGADFGIEDSADVLLARVRSAISEGYRRVKLKIGAVDQLVAVRAVREAFPDLTLHVDANAGFSPDDMAFFQELDALELAMIEQPLAVDDLVAHARLQEELWTPICLDESITSHESAVRAVEMGACQVINIKPGRVGGLTVAVAISELCRERGVGSWVGGMLESGIGAAICAALATLDGNTYPADIFPSHRFYARDMAEPALEFTDGPDGGRFVMVPPDAGIAQEPDARELPAATLANVRFTA